MEGRKEGRKEGRGTKKKKKEERRKRRRRGGGVMEKMVEGSKLNVTLRTLIDCGLSLG